MDSPCRVETGIQVFARLLQPPSLSSLHCLFRNGPKPSHVIEVSYENDVPQDVLVCEIIAKAILPKEYGGKDASVVILLTDGHFNVKTLSYTLSYLLKSCDNPQDIINTCLKNVHTMTIYDSQQMFISIQSLEYLLGKYNNMALIVVDTISAFYWSDRLFESSMMKMDNHIKRILRLIQMASKEYKSVILYTRPSYFVSKTQRADEPIECVYEPTLERINYKIMLKKHEDNFKAFMETHQCVTEKIFIFNENQIYWLY